MIRGNLQILKFRFLQLCANVYDKNYTSQLYRRVGSECNAGQDDSRKQQHENGICCNQYLFPYK